MIESKELRLFTLEDNGQTLIYTQAVEADGIVKYIVYDINTDPKIKSKLLFEFSKSGMSLKGKYQIIGVDFDDMNCPFIAAEDVVENLLNKLLIVPLHPFL